MRSQNRALCLPDYLCESQVSILQGAGIPFSFYTLGPDLTPATELLQKTAPKNAAVLIINYFGLLNLDEIGRQIRTERPDLHLIGDIVQNPLMIPSLQIYDYCYTSLRKYFPVPDGAEVFPATLPAPTEKPDEGFIQGKLQAASRKFLYLRESKRRTTEEQTYLDEFMAAEDRIARTPVLSTISEPSLAILDGLNPAEITKKRRENYLFLSRELRSVGLSVPGLTESAAPVCLPLWTNRRNELREHFANQGIFCPIHWPSFDQLPECAMGRSLAQFEIGLPLDQRYGERQMNRLLAAFKVAMNSITGIEAKFLIAPQRNLLKFV